jgi:mevalonate kinase
MSSFYRGKIILTGEHSVVHGYSAILASLDLGVSCTAKEGNLEEAQKLDPYLQHLLQIFSKMTKIKEFNLSLKIDSNLPIKSGLGSSAAFAAAVFSELANFYNYSLNSDRLYNLVLEAENFIHGHSSGADPSIVVYGGLIAFKKGQMRQLAPSILVNKTFFLIDSGEATESTGEMIKKVASTESNQQILSEIGDLSQKILNDLENDNFNPQLLNENQSLLEKIGVVSPKAMDLIKKLQKFGACCKITGAGGVKTGSGYILAFHEESQKFEEYLKDMSLIFFKTQLGGIK